MQAFVKTLIHLSHVIQKLILPAGLSSNTMDVLHFSILEILHAKT